MPKSKPRRSRLNPEMTKTMKKLWSSARREVRKKAKDKKLRKQRLVGLADTHLEVAGQLVKLAQFLVDNSN
jgi:hypothetical protein